MCEVGHLYSGSDTSKESFVKGEEAEKYGVEQLERIQAGEDDVIEQNFSSGR